MSWFYKPYVSAAERRRKAYKKVDALRKKGEVIEPVTAATLRGKIALSFWGRAWCDHLESLRDISNRLPRGRTYLRNGSVLHLAISTGHIRALVMGSELYEQNIHIAPLPLAQWERVKTRCQGKIGSLIELLQGNISDDVMAVVTDRTDGLFPSLEEILRMNCSCPDWAGVCKHLAAILYGVGSRLDDSPELLFKLRGVDHAELIQTDAAALVAQGADKGKRRRLAPAALNNVFGIEIEDDSDLPPPAPAPTKAKKTAAQKKSASPKKKTTPAKPIPTRRSRTKKAPRNRNPSGDPT